MNTIPADPYHALADTGRAKKILALDGGGIRGMITVEVLGTGVSPEANADLGPDEMNILYNARSIPSALMFGVLNEQDFLCRQR